MGPILVVAEFTEGELSDTSRELLTKARELAQSLGSEVIAVGFGSHAEHAMANADADRAVAITGLGLDQYLPLTYERTLSQIVSEYHPLLTMVANSTMGLDLGAGVAAAQHMPVIAYCNGLHTDAEDIVAQCQAFAGKLLAEVAVPAGGAVITVLPGSFGSSGTSGHPEVTVMAVDSVPGMDVVKILEPEKGDVDITRADILVSVGRGIGDPENLGLAQELAEAIGGVVSCSRPVVDAGWLPKARQVGKSGQTVKPKLYLALGISGAPEHLQGMKDADLIIAANTDESSSIMEVAHYGTTVDILDLMPALAERLRGE